MYKKWLSLVSALVGLILIPGVLFAAAPFYEGKNIRFILASSPGGGFDTYARVLCRHLGKHIPGNPTIIVENTSGAGGLILANQLYKITKPNGLTIGQFNGALLFARRLGLEGAEFESTKFEFIGAMAKVTPVCILSKESGITNMDQWMSSKTPVKLGGNAPGTLAPDDTPTILKAALGLPIHLVSGYKGTPEIRQAMQSREVAGCFLGWESARTTWRKDLEAGNASVVLQAVPKPLPGLSKVPLAISFAKTEEARRLIEVGIHNNSLFARPFLVSPGVPKDRVQALRNAFQETLKDKEFLADAEKTRLDLDPVTGEELQAAVAELSKIDPALITKLKKILYNQ